MDMTEYGIAALMFGYGNRLTNVILRFFDLLLCNSAKLQTGP